jgi:hypothetical protein
MHCANGWSRELRGVSRGKGDGRRGGSGRVAGGFVALPWDVLDSEAYLGLGYPARALLMDVARQYDGKNNGRMLLSRAHLAKRGWHSADVIQRAKTELVAAGFIFETVKGQRPNKASWYACTWWTLDRLEGYDAYALAAFQKAAYRTQQNASLVPSPGTGRATIVPSPGTGAPASVPSPGPIRTSLPPLSVPSPGHLLEVAICGPTTSALLAVPGIGIGEFKGVKKMAPQSTAKGAA